MKVAISGSTSKIGQLLIPILRNDFNAEITSIGRNHHPDCHKKIDWNLGNDLKILDSNFDFFLHFAYDRKFSNRHIASNVNLIGTQKILDAISAETQILLPASFSSSATGKSLYSRVKWSQEQMVSGRDGLLMRFGIILNEDAAQEGSNNLMRTYAKLPIVLLPSKKMKKIHFSSEKSLGRGFFLALTQGQSIEISDYYFNFSDFLNLYFARERIQIELPLPIILSSCRFIRNFSATRLATIADSLLSLYPD